MRCHRHFVHRLIEIKRRAFIGTTHILTKSSAQPCIVVLCSFLPEMDSPRLRFHRMTLRGECKQGTLLNSQPLSDLEQYTLHKTTHKDNLIFPIQAKVADTYGHLCFFIWQLKTFQSRGYLYKKFQDLAVRFTRVKQSEFIVDTFSKENRRDTM